MARYLYIALFSFLFSDSVPGDYWKSKVYKIQKSDKHYNGIDSFFDGDISDFHEKNIAVVANHTSVNTSGETLVDLVKKYLTLKE